MGLVNELKEASTLKELETLLKEGKSYKMASDSTKRKWTRIARRKMVEFNSPSVPPEEPAETDTKAEETASKKPKKKKVPYRKPRRS